MKIIKSSFIILLAIIFYACKNDIKEKVSLVDLHKSTESIPQKGSLEYIKKADNSFNALNFDGSIEGKTKFNHWKDVDLFYKQMLDNQKNSEYLGFFKDEVIGRLVSESSKHLNLINDGKEDTQKALKFYAEELLSSYSPNPKVVLHFINNLKEVWTQDEIRNYSTKILPKLQKYKNVIEASYKNISHSSDKLTEYQEKIQMDNKMVLEAYQKIENYTK
jgi:hypothetical protein